MKDWPFLLDFSSDCFCDDVLTVLIVVTETVTQDYLMFVYIYIAE